MNTSIPRWLLAACSSVLLVACSDKHDDPAPAPADPTPAFTLSSYFDFVVPTPTGGVSHEGYGTAHSSLAIKGSAALGSQVLALDFAAGTDDVHFEVDQAALGTAWTGTYMLRSRNQPTAPVFTSYIYQEANGVASIYRFSDSSRDLVGGVTITAYDAKRRLISGRFAVEAPRQRDPLAGLGNVAPCTILLDGEFTNLKVAQ